MTDPDNCHSQVRQAAQLALPTLPQGIPSGNRIKVLLPEGDEAKKVPNVVYKEVLQGLDL